MDRGFARVTVMTELVKLSLLECLVGALSSDAQSAREWGMNYLMEYSLLLRKWGKEYPESGKMVLEAMDTLEVRQDAAS